MNDYIARLHSMVSDLRNLDEIVDENRIIDCLINGLTDKYDDLQRNLHTRRLTTDEHEEIHIQEESIRKHEIQAPRNNLRGRPPLIRPPLAPDTHLNQEPRSSQDLRFSHYLCQDSRPPQDPRPASDMCRCRTCGDLGHLERNFPLVTCSYCGQHGHIARDCQYSGQYRARNHSRSPDRNYRPSNSHTYLTQPNNNPPQTAPTTANPLPNTSNGCRYSHCGRDNHDARNWWELHLNLRPLLSCYPNGSNDVHPQCQQHI